MSSSTAPRDAAAVILVRDRDDQAGNELEVLLLCRHRGSGFMANAFVFPGGVAEPDDDGDLRVTAARELFEEGGVLIGSSDLDAQRRQQARERINSGECARDVMTSVGSAFDPSALHYFAHWLTPSAERRRYSAKFYVARMPAGQQASFDAVETVDQVWVTADEALARSKELKLPPPQVRTFADMRAACSRGWSALTDLAAERAQKPAVILPRFAPIDASAGGKSRFALLLPWDPDYDRLGTGDALAIDNDHPLAHGPSRFVLEDETWKNIDAPASPTAD